MNKNSQKKRKQPPHIHKARDSKNTDTDKAIRAAFRVASAVLLISLVAGPVAAALMEDPHAANNGKVKKTDAQKFLDPSAVEKVVTEEVKDDLILPNLSQGKVQTTGKFVTRLAGEKTDGKLGVVYSGGGTAGANTAGALKSIKWIQNMMSLCATHGNDLDTLLDAMALAEAKGQTNGEIKDFGDVKILSSVGFINWMFGISTNVDASAGIYPENMDKRFMNIEKVIENFLTHAIAHADVEEPGMNLTYLRGIMDGSAGPDKALNMSKVVEAANALDQDTFVAVSTMTGKPALINLRGMTAEQIEDLIYKVCNVDGIGPKPDKILDRRSNGSDVPISDCAADNTVVFINGPANVVPDESFVQMAVGYFTTACGYNYVETSDDFEMFAQRFVATVNGKKVNAKQIKEAMGKDNYLFFGSPRNQGSFSSAETRPEVLENWIAEADLYGRYLTTVGGVEAGKITLKKNKVYEIQPLEYKKLNKKLVIKTDKDGNIKSGVIQTTSMKKRSVPTAKVTKPADPFLAIPAERRNAANLREAARRTRRPGRPETSAYTRNILNRLSRTPHR